VHLLVGTAVEVECRANASAVYERQLVSELSFEVPAVTVEAEASVIASYYEGSDWEDARSLSVILLESVNMYPLVVIYVGSVALDVICCRS
jgi:hypothetical protein